MFTLSRAVLEDIRSRALAYLLDGGSIFPSPDTDRDISAVDDIGQEHFALVAKHDKLSAELDKANLDSPTRDAIESACSDLECAWGDASYYLGLFVGLSANSLGAIPWSHERRAKVSR